MYDSLTVYNICVARKFTRNILVYLRLWDVTYQARHGHFPNVWWYSYSLYMYSYSDIMVGLLVIDACSARQDKTWPVSLHQPGEKLHLWHRLLLGTINNIMNQHLNAKSTTLDEKIHINMYVYYKTVEMSSNPFQSSQYFSCKHCGKPTCELSNYNKDETMRNVSSSESNTCLLFFFLLLICLKTSGIAWDCVDNEIMSLDGEQ